MKVYFFLINRRFGMPGRATICRDYTARSERAALAMAKQQYVGCRVRLDLVATREAVDLAECGIPMHSGWDRTAAARAAADAELDYLV